jgi:hypothetical protein
MRSGDADPDCGRVGARDAAHGLAAESAKADFVNFQRRIHSLADPDSAQFRPLRGADGVAPEPASDPPLPQRLREQRARRRLLRAEYARLQRSNGGAKSSGSVDAGRPAMPRPLPSDAARLRCTSAHGFTNEADQQGSARNLHPANEFAAWKPRCRPAPTVRADGETVPRRQALQARRERRARAVEALFVSRLGRETGLTAVPAAALAAQARCIGIALLSHSRTSAKPTPCPTAAS